MMEKKCIKSYIILSLSVLIIYAKYSQAEETEIQEVKELEVVNFENIKKVLQKDGLSKTVKKKINQVKRFQKEKIKIDNQKYFYPPENEFWGFLSEYWLVKNAQVLKWDFTKPHYGIEESFKNLLENLGFYQERFKILLLNSPMVVRAGLPGDNESILLISLPFIKSLDLSKLEISLLLFEDLIRLKQNYFKQKTATSSFKKIAGSSFFGSKPDISIVEKVLNNYSELVFKKGFSFQEQFEVTKKMDSFLKSKPELWNAYFNLLKKMDQFIKVNVQYQSYFQLYPSPQMQLKWLSPDEKVL